MVCVAFWRLHALCIRLLIPALAALCILVDVTHVSAYSLRKTSVVNSKPAGNIGVPGVCMSKFRGHMLCDRSRDPPRACHAVYGIYCEGIALPVNCAIKHRSIRVELKRRVVVNVPVRCEPIGSCKVHLRIDVREDILPAS